MDDRLDKICFLPPAADTPWTGPPPDSHGIDLVRRDGAKVHLKLPLFWFDPPWHHVDPRSADRIAVLVSQWDVVVSAMQSDLSNGEKQPAFCTPLVGESTTNGDVEKRSDEAEWFRPRIVPYRPERYGFQPSDFVGPRIVDVRLSPARDPEGHFGYSPERIARWEATPQDEPVAGGGWVPGASFPPDVPSLAQLDRKLQQLRQLADRSAVFVSCGSHRLKDELPAILDAQPDGVILRLDDIQLTGLQLAEVTVVACQMISQASNSVPLWIVPGPITADDAAKLLALGASAIAVDNWCNKIIAAASQADPSAVGDALFQQSIAEHLLPKIERFKGLCSSMQSIASDQRLACLNGRWAKALRICALALPGVVDDV